MNRLVWIVGGFLLLIFTPIVLAITLRSDEPYIPTLRWRQPTDMPPIERPVDSPSPKEEVETGTPKAVFGEILHDFELLPPDTHGEHIFLVMNEGDGVLRLRKGTTTCKCTGIELLDPEIAPGEVGRVKIMWRTASSQDRYRHWGNVLTNDPDLPEEQLTVQGRVKVTLGQTPPELSFPRLIRGKPQTQSLLIFSQDWESFHLGDLDTSWEGATWRVKPACAEALENAEALSGYEVEFTTPSEFEDREFTHWLKYEVVPGDPSIKPRSRETTISCRVLRSLSVYGAQMREGGIVDLGVIDRGESTTAHLLLRSRSFEGALEIENVKCEPEYLQVSLTPFSGEGADQTFHLDITIPETAPASRYQPGKYGEIEIVTNHPLEPIVRLKVELEVRREVVFP